MPGFLIEQDLRAGRLLSIAGRHLRGGRAELVAARGADTPTARSPIASGAISATRRRG